MAKKLLGVKGYAFRHCGPVRNREVISDERLKMVDLGYKLLLNPPHYLGLTSFYLYLHQNLKKPCGGQKFWSNKEFIAAKYAQIADLRKRIFLDGLKLIDNRWVKCIVLK